MRKLSNTPVTESWRVLLLSEPFFLDIPVVNSAALELAKKYNATYTFECARMYHGTAPDLATGRIFGITTFELG